MKNNGLKEKNYQSIYKLIYDQRIVSKQEIADSLDLSLPTVSNNLQRLEKNGLIQKNGTYTSTGGRPAIAYECHSDRYYAIGMEITSGGIHMAAIDLYGYILSHKEINISFVDEPAYFQKICGYLNDFIENISLPLEDMLGITLAIQGIVSRQGEDVIFSGLLNNANISKADFSDYIQYPFQIAHDAEAAGYAELWQYKDLDTALYISLNEYMGSAMIVNGKLVKNNYLGAGTVEHMILYPNGNKCYCGAKGCADTVIGVKYLQEKLDVELPVFFEHLHNGDEKYALIWDEYLTALATVIYNVRMVMECDIVLGGKLEIYLTDDDYRTIKEKVKNIGSLGKMDFNMIPGHYGDYAAVIGAGLLLIREFLESIPYEN